MVLKKQTVWLLSMLTIMVVLSAYYLIQGPVEQVPVATDAKGQKANPEVQVDSKQVVDGKKVDVNVVPGSSDYFTEAKLERDEINYKRLEDYMAVISNSDATAEAIAQAKESYEKLAEKQEVETNVESLIKALGYNEAVIITQDDRVNVIVQAEKMEPKQVVEIMNVVKQNLETKNVVVSYKP